MKSNSTKVIGLLIAAGSSKRLGQAKQLVEYQGQSLIQYIVGEMKDSGLEDVLVVLGSKADQIEPLIPHTRIIVNSNWSEGMGSSIRYGVEQLAKNHQPIMICLVDQYKLKAKIINELLAAYQVHIDTILASQFGNGIIGPPVIFPPEFLDELLKLSGDQGAGKLIRKRIAENPNSVFLHPFPEGHYDVDVPEDLKRLSR